MKTTISIFLISLSLSLSANDGKYFEAMSKQMQAVYNGQTLDELQSAVNSLDRIGQAEKDKWEPLYYGAFGYVMMANRETEATKKDNYLDQALERVNKAAAISKDNSEITALEGFIHMIRVTVDPASRGQQYSGMSMQAYGKAIEQNPNNPRALALMAQMQFGMAQFFKSPVTEACGLARKALEQFSAYKSDNPLAPAWGQGMTEGLLKQCQ
ncbi:MAG: hypothetical protein K2U26_18790 [Cyclobacteriaceae bacterium]|nr:hypothetical protein [Cyclobacteriaceae bacterium]